MAVNFSKNQDEITNAWRDVVDSSKVPKWALFGYEGSSNVIRLMATGSRGLDELVEEFNCSLIQYAFCRVIDESLGLNRLILINWQGDSAPLSRKGLCASHVGDVSNYFKGCAQTITIRNDDEATKEHLMEQIIKSSTSKLGLSRVTSQTTPNGTSEDSSIKTLNETNDSSIIDASVSSSSEPTTVSSVYKKVDISSDITASRKSFWQRQEEEEKERIAEEKRKAAEKQAQFEKERKQREEMEAKKLAETIKQREQLIEATKKADKVSATNTNQSNSIISTSSSVANDFPDDDGRVGRRSELIRLERNQETQSLISKGLIKNKRAIFEQAQQQQQQQQPTLSRRSSGVTITKRVSAFKSLDNNTNSNASSKNEVSTSNVAKLSDSFSKQVNVNGDESAKDSPKSDVSCLAKADESKTPVKKEIEAVTLTRESDSNDASSPSSVVVTSTIESTNVDANSTINTSADSNTQQTHENGSGGLADESQDINGNNDNSFSPKKSSNSETAESANDFITNEDLIMNGKNSNIKALALFDYQAADNTEISFDPDDHIGHIQKVDPGWWHGQVISGRFKGQIGLFPANYVQEL